MPGVPTSAVIRLEEVNNNGRPRQRTNPTLTSSYTGATTKYLHAHDKVFRHDVLVGGGRRRHGRKAGEKASHSTRPGKRRPGFSAMLQFVAAVLVAVILAAVEGSTRLRSERRTLAEPYHVQHKEISRLSRESCGKW